MTDAAVDIDQVDTVRSSVAAIPRETVEIRVRGIVQGVGFRPTVWRIARELGLGGEVRNDAAGVSIVLSGDSDTISRFSQRLTQEAPPLSHIESIETRKLAQFLNFHSFEIVKSAAGETRTQVAPDAATCQACREEVLNPLERRYHYPFTNCTHCGPRISIVRGIPYDRANTTMNPFPLCEDCAREYENPADRRFHAQPIACAVCGPRVWLERPSLNQPPQTQEEREGEQNHRHADAIALAAASIRQGEIVAIRGLGGFHLACDATNEVAVQRLRARKQRFGKPFALMARDLETIRRYCRVTEAEQQVLESPQAPIVILSVRGSEALPDSVAPGIDCLGFMLPYTPLHLLLLNLLDRPVVMTSGNLSHEPQAIGNDMARDKLKEIADVLLLHNREIANRIDDSVVRFIGKKPRLLRRARGYAPRAIPLPAGFEAAPPLLAHGGELKSTFCLVKDGAAIVSQHQGDLEDVDTFEDYQKNLDLYANLYDHHPQVLVSDLHPEYLSTKLAKQAATTQRLPLIEVQHHHAHIASCLVENGVPLTTPPVLGIALDGLGFGTDGTLWGGEFLLADYRSFQRLATLKPISMIGGAQAMREPWRNTYAHLMSSLGWEQFASQFGSLELYAYLAEKPRQTIDRMLKRGLNVPLASSCGRLFDAVAAAVGLCRDLALFEGQAAIELEMVADAAYLQAADDSQAYPFTVATLPDTGLTYLEPRPMWQALLGDLQSQVPIPAIAARFHQGFARTIASLVKTLAYQPLPDFYSPQPQFNTVALSGGCFQNKILLEEVTRRIEEIGFRCLSQAKVPSNDGGVSLGQAAIAAAQSLSSTESKVDSG